MYNKIFQFLEIKLDDIALDLLLHSLEDFAGLVAHLLHKNPSKAKTPANNQHIKKGPNQFLLDCAEAYEDVAANMPAA